jgi:hypothetical protein
MSSARPSPLFRPIDETVRQPSWLSPQEGVVRLLAFQGPGASPRALSVAPPPVAEALPTIEAEPRLALPLASEEPAVDPLAEERASIARERAELSREREALAQEREALAQERDAVAELARGLVEARAETLSALEVPLLELSGVIAEALVGDALGTRSELHVRLARRAIETLGDAEGVRLRASSAGYDALVSVLGEPALTIGATRVPVDRDANLDGFGFVAEAGRARVDAMLSTLVGSVRDALAHEQRREVAP